MIVTVHIVFCYLKEAFQSLLFKYREGHSVDHVGGGQLRVKPMNELKDSAISEFLQQRFATVSSLSFCYVWYRKSYREERAAYNSGF